MNSNQYPMPALTDEQRENAKNAAIRIADYRNIVSFNDDGFIRLLAEVALAVLTAPKPEPVAFTSESNLRNLGGSACAMWGLADKLERHVPLYAAPSVLADLLPDLHDIPDGHDLTSCMAGAAWYQQMLKHRLTLLDSGKWKMVPVEPTEDMVIRGFESEPKQYLGDPAVWEEFEAMSGCQQAAHIATLCYKAMLAAAPAVK